jgi:hypothetical protein
MKQIGKAVVYLIINLAALFIFNSVAIFVNNVTKSRYAIEIAIITALAFFGWYGYNFVSKVIKMYSNKKSED